MTPKEKRPTGEQPLMGTRLEFLIDLDHELVRLAQTINWDGIAAEFRPMYCPDNGRPAVPTRLMAGLQLLKATEATSGLNDGLGQIGSMYLSELAEGRYPTAQAVAGAFP